MQTEHGMSDEDSEVDRTGADEDEANKALNDGIEGRHDWMTLSSLLHVYTRNERDSGLVGWRSSCFTTIYCYTPNVSI